MLYSARSIAFTGFAITIGIAGTAAIAERERPEPAQVRVRTVPYVVPFDRDPEVHTEPWAGLLGVVEFVGPNADLRVEPHRREAPQDGPPAR